jgi:hypothetical protein
MGIALCALSVPTQKAYEDRDILSSGMSHLRENERVVKRNMMIQYRKSRLWTDVRRKPEPGIQQQDEVPGMI